MTAINLTSALAVILAVVSAAQAGVTGMNFSTVPNSAGGAPLANFITTDVRVNATGTLRAQGMLLELTQGTIYQEDVFGTNRVPATFFFPFVPSLRFDTFVTFGAVATPGPPGTVQQDSDMLIPGGTGVDIPGGGAPVTFNNQKLDIVWAPGGGINYPGTDNFVTARVSLSKDAMGTLKYLGTTSTDITSATWFRATVPVLEGQIGLAGDFDGNLAVGAGDLNLVLNNWGATVPPVPAGWNGRQPPAGQIGASLLNEVLNNWGNVAGSWSGTANEGLSAIPEPATGALAVFVLLSFLGGTRYQRSS
jgi:hypothetical protein